MNQFKIVPLQMDYVSKIQTQKVDDFKYPVVEQIATGYGPCRITLEPFTPEKDKRLLFSYTPFDIDNAFNQPGPIFIHKKKVKPYSDIHRFPPKIKADKKNFPLTLMGYNEQQEMVFTQLVGNHDVDQLITTIFNTNKTINYLHARNAEAGCYICKIERV